MGGDHGPSVTIPAAKNFLQKYLDAHLILVGLEDKIHAALGQHAFGDRLSIVHATQVVEMHEAPALALKNKKDSSMRVALNLVKDGSADACVSAGNTGALMATSRFVLKMLPGIDRPALCQALPSGEGHTYVLDLGANVDCSPEHLLQFGIMGGLMAAAMDHKEQPTIGLLNIGSEDIKGNEVVKAAAELLGYSGLNFIGNIEGDGIFKGEADVIVCDGFVGNVALKAAEGVAQMMGSGIREEFKRNLLTKLAAIVAWPVLGRFKKRVDHRRYNGALLLGLKGISVKSHGSADIFSFTKAIERAYDAAANRVVERITERILAIEAAAHAPHVLSEEAA